ncbi:CSP41B [Scenedesmus sp. PABB004]|nr:CSP41B [Scenedesmus sp. PABB004]
MAAAPAPPPHEADPLAVLLRHPSVTRNQEVWSRLLAAAPALAVAVAARCAGALSARFSAHGIAAVRAFALWLAKHGGLLRSLQLSLNLAGRERSEAEAAIAAALQRADAAVGLQLTTYRSYPACAGPVMQYLPAWWLRVLELGPRADYSDGFALEGLTRLASLSLHGDTADVLLPSVAALSKLTHLTLADVAATSLAKLKWVPPQLVALHLSLAHIRRGEALPVRGRRTLRAAGLLCGGGGGGGGPAPRAHAGSLLRAPQSLVLTHLTALTSLSSDGRPLVVQAGDALPAGLAALRVRDVRAAAPLLGLTRLTGLEMSLSLTPADDLRAIAASLPQLAHVALCYDDTRAAAAAAPAWAALPLRRLDFLAVGGGVDAATLAELGKLQGLLHLDVHGGAGCCRESGVFEATPREFAAVLGRMTGLQELGLRGFELLPEDPAPSGDAAAGGAGGSADAPDAAAAAGGGDAAANNAAGAALGAGGLEAVMAAIAGLPQLSSLSWTAIYAAKASHAPLTLDEAAAAALCGASALTSLSLCDCGLSDAGVNAIAAGLSQLQVLKLDQNPGVSPDVLPPAVAARLRLRELSVLRTGIRHPAFRARLVALHPRLVVKSSTRSSASAFVGARVSAKAVRPAAPGGRAARLAVSCATSYVEPKKVLMMGGTRFIGLYLARQLAAAGHEVTLYTRGKKAITSQIADDTDASYARFAGSVKHIAGDRQDFDDVRRKLGGSGFQVVFDINGREAVEVEPVLDALAGRGGSLEQYIYCSSAGVYLKSDMMPHREEDAVDPKSRHKGKLDTEELLRSSGVNFTSVRPVYIYGPLNYNPVEEYFFHRLKAGRPITVPGSGMQVTQLGHVKDLSDAFMACVGNPDAARQVFNISGERFVTFDGIARACAKAMGAPEPELVHFNAKDFDFGKKKAFPMRDQHFYASIDKAQALLGWSPKFGLVEGLKDSYDKDFGLGQCRKAADFETDDMILQRLGSKSYAYSR